MFFPYHDDNPTQRFPLVTVGLIVINVLLFLQLQSLPEQKQIERVIHQGFVPARIGSLFSRKPVVIVVEHPHQQHPLLPWQIRLPRQVYQLSPNFREVAQSLFTCMFLHGGWAHLIGNMWFLWLFGNNVEDRLGASRFITFYLIGGLLATGVHWITDPGSTRPVIGASGAISAILGAYAVTWPWARIHTMVFLGFFLTRLDLPALVVLGFWFLGQLLEAIQAIQLGIDGGVAWWAHIGGFVAGLFLMPPLRNAADQNQLAQWRRQLQEAPTEDSEAW
ncbi:MAG: rhomboid family intramembrane serine protease [Thermoguttaceae bacterium]|nr:rhomboid family intramembrane serine protease [Thermoguttaceae bacterium]MDW8038400.1 rhomboid family intramembrane serine protease [Thermoguttaceae bacterium]